MNRSRHFAAAGVGLAVLLGTGDVFGESSCSPDGVQESGSIYRICMPAPEDYNGRLVIWAHGFQDAGTPVQIPENQLGFGDILLSELFNELGFGFATNSYSKTGLAIRQGMEDILDLVAIFSREQGAPLKVYLTGASEGGIITTLLVEQHPESFDAGVAACGPVGDFSFQIKYFGDARATFEYFFPDLIPGDPFNPTPELVEGWSDYYEAVVKPALFLRENVGALEDWVTVARLPFDPENWEESVEKSARDALRYSVVNLNDAAETLGGFPYENYGRIYLGSSNDVRLNIFVPRVAADAVALHEMDEHYDTSGELTVPLITMHTRLDQQVPYFHETIYTIKNLIAGSYLNRRLNIPIDRFGHCNFTEGEAIFAFAVMLIYAEDIESLSRVADRLSAQQMKKLKRISDSRQ